MGQIFSNGLEVAQADPAMLVADITKCRAKLAETDGNMVDLREFQIIMKAATSVSDDDFESAQREQRYRVKLFGVFSDHGDSGMFGQPKIDAKEVLCALCFLADGTPDEKLAELFAMFDDDGNLELDADELAEMLECTLNGLVKLMESEPISTSLIPVLVKR